MDSRHVPPFLRIDSSSPVPPGPRELTMTKLDSGGSLSFVGHADHPPTREEGDSIYRFLFAQEGMWFLPPTHVVFAEWEVGDPERVTPFLDSRRALFLTRRQSLTYFALDAAYERVGEPGVYLIVGFYGNEESATTLCRSHPAIVEFAAGHSAADYRAVDRTGVQVYRIEHPWSTVYHDPSLDAPRWTRSERAELIAELERNQADIHREVDGLSEPQLEYSAPREAWSIRDVIEHVAMLEEYYHSWLSVLSLGPETPEFAGRVRGKDADISHYAQEFNVESLTIPASPALTRPVGRFSDSRASSAHFDTVRSMVVRFVAETDADLRRHFTFRRYQEPRFNVRDLHQLVLTDIAHADWHVHHIRHIKSSAGFP